MADSARVGCSFETRGGLDRRTRRLRMLSSARCHVPGGFCQPLRRQAHRTPLNYVSLVVVHGNELGEVRLEGLGDERLDVGVEFFSVDNDHGWVGSQAGCICR